MWRVLACRELAQGTRKESQWGELVYHGRRAPKSDGGEDGATPCLPLGRRLRAENPNKTLASSALLQGCQLLPRSPAPPLLGNGAHYRRTGNKPSSTDPVCNLRHTWRRTEFRCRRHKWGCLKGVESSRRFACCCPSPLSPTWKTGTMACTPPATLDYEATKGMGAVATDGRAER